MKSVQPVHVPEMEITLTPISRLLRRAIDAVLPPRCAMCGIEIPSDGCLCLDCWQALTFISHPLCTSCGDPFEIQPLGPAICGDCLAKPPVYDRARSALIYDDASRSLILSYKHADRTMLTGLLAGWLMAAGGELLDDAEVIVPVPLNRWRLIARRYNQAALLAHALGRRRNIPVVDGCLIRHKRTPSQGRRTARQRALNVRGAFSAADPAAIKGKRVLLIDDVLTTGATVSACARVLKRAGVSTVDVLTIARVV